MYIYTVGEKRSKRVLFAIGKYVIFTGWMGENPNEDDRLLGLAQNSVEIRMRWAFHTCVV